MNDMRTPWQLARDEAERTGTWPEGWGPFHRHFANDAVHRDGGPECDQPGTPRRVYVFDPDTLDEHERAVARLPALDMNELLGLVRHVAARDEKVYLNRPQAIAARHTLYYVSTGMLELRDYVVADKMQWITAVASLEKYIGQLTALRDYLVPGSTTAPPELTSERQLPPVGRTE